MKLTPVLLVEDIEKSLEFWIDRLGFEKTVDVPEDGRLAFVILVNAGAEVMLQTWKSASKDAPSLAADRRAGGVALFIEVEDFADIRKRVEGCEVIMPERLASYGMREITVREPGGHPVCFAAREAAG